MRAVLPFVILLGAAACSREPSAPAPVTKPAAAPVAAPVAEDSVAAVLQSPGSAPVAMRFAALGKPAVGKASQLRLDFAGEPGTLSLRLQGEGLVIEPATATVIIAEDGKPVSQSIAVTPRAAGISEIVVRVQTAKEAAPEVIYAVPLLVEGAASR